MGGGPGAGEEEEVEAEKEERVGYTRPALPSFSWKVLTLH